MEAEDNNIELIEAYVKGELSPAELDDFNRRRSSDPLFEQEVIDYLLIIKEIRSSQELAFAEKLKLWESNITAGVTERKVIPIRRIVAIAASVLILAVVGYSIFKISPGKDHQELFALHFIPYKDVISERSGGSDLLQQGMDRYNRKAYAEAISYLEKYLDKRPGEHAVECYLGISYLANNNLEQAEGFLENVARQDGGLYKEIAQWNLVLIALKRGDDGSVKKELREILDQKDHLYAEEARALRQDL